ncbi:MAG TPA: hypothetical protein VFI30_08200 [Nocardioidaceae bacterium]|nr:hypothetical protein [Nocardioidaceae bacterium]
MGAALAVALVSCGGHSGGPSSGPSHWWPGTGWGAIYGSSNPSTLYLLAIEGGPKSQAAMKSHCWISYRAAARWNGKEFEVALDGVNRDPSSNFNCNAQAYGPLYTAVHLPRAYHGQKVVDARTGRAHPVFPTVYPTKSQLVGWAP